MSTFQYFSQLPPQIRQQVMDFVEFLMRKYAESQPDAPINDDKSLRGSVIKYDDPFGPAVSDGDWEVYG